MRNSELFFSQRFRSSFTHLVLARLSRIRRQERGKSPARATFPSPSAPVLLFIAGWHLLGQGFRFRRGCRAPKLCRYAITSPQLGALHRSDEFAAHWLFRLY